VSERLRALHPAHGPELGPQGDLPDHVPTFGEEPERPHLGKLVEEAILSFGPGSAAGPTGLRPSHLKDCLSKAGVGTELCEALGGWCDVAIEGRLPVGCRDLVCGANLIPLNKKDGGSDP
jgi:hypothetical protein